MRTWSLAALLALAIHPGTVCAYQGGKLPNHAHTSAAGQGGSLSASAITTAGGVIESSSPTLTGAWKFSTSSLEMAGPVVYSVKSSSSGPIDLGIGITQTVPVSCVGGSTRTLTAQGSEFIVSFSGDLKGATSETLSLGLLVNGDIPAPWKTSTKQAVTAVYTHSADSFNASFSVPVAVTPGASVSVCLMAWAASGAINIGYAAQPMFSIRESR